MILAGLGPRVGATAPLVAVATLVIACATVEPAGHPAAAEKSRSASMPGWPESWGIEFGLRCAAAGEDVRFCTCLANAVQKRWTLEQFRSLGPEGFEDEVRACRQRIGEVEAQWPQGAADKP
jgi:hypothetical protein